jgi:hypothetical protein
MSKAATKLMDPGNAVVPPNYGVDRANFPRAYPG